MGASSGYLPLGGGGALAPVAAQEWPRDSARAPAAALGTSALFPTQPPAPSWGKSTFDEGVAYYRDLSRILRDPQADDAACAGGDCHALRARRIMELGLGILPFALTLFCCGYLTLSFLAAHRRARGKVKHGRPVLIAKVARVSRAHFDLYSWFHCFKVVQVQRSAETLMNVYLPWDAEDPKPGQTLAIFQISDPLWKRRHVAVSLDVLRRA